MAYPHHVTQLSGKLVVSSDIDGATSANRVVHAATQQLDGLYFDDSTPNDSAWITKATPIALAAQPPLTLFCAVAPGQLGWHHKPSPPCLNMIEWYPDHAGVPAVEFYPYGCPRHYYYVIVQHNYPGMVIESLPPDRWPPPPTAARKLELIAQALARVGGNRDRVWLY